MRVKVSAEGLLIPPAYLEGITEAEIIEEDRRIVIIPTDYEDSIWELSNNPVTDSMTDGSVNRDDYLNNRARIHFLSIRKNFTVLYLSRPQDHSLHHLRWRRPFTSSRK